MENGEGGEMTDAFAIAASKEKAANAFFIIWTFIGWLILAQRAIVHAVIVFIAGIYIHTQYVACSRVWRQTHRKSQSATFKYTSCNEYTFCNKICALDA